MSIIKSNWYYICRVAPLYHAMSIIKSNCFIGCLCNSSLQNPLSLFTKKHNQALPFSFAASFSILSAGLLSCSSVVCFPLSGAALWAVHPTWLTDLEHFFLGAKYRFVCCELSLGWWFLATCFLYSSESSKSVLQTVHLDVTIWTVINGKLLSLYIDKPKITYIVDMCIFCLIKRWFS